MPELPEVETTRRGIEPHLVGRRVAGVVVRRGDLRQPVSPSLESVTGMRFAGVGRRSKYLLLRLEPGDHLLVHLGMSGSLRLVNPADEPRRHDHLMLRLDSGRELRFHDPRRFGLFLHLPAGEDPAGHPLLRGLGPEPLEEGFDGCTLRAACRDRKAAIKLRIMDPAVVVGVGNIYASEALFRAGIRPRIAAGRVSGPRLDQLARSIRQVLGEAIRSGGTTLRDFVSSDGQPGYFRQRLFVYGRGGEPCRKCGTTIRHAIVGQRSTFWCPACQR